MLEEPLSVGAETRGQVATGLWVWSRRRNGGKPSIQAKHMGVGDKNVWGWRALITFSFLSVSSPANQTVLCFHLTEVETETQEFQQFAQDHKEPG